MNTQSEQSERQPVLVIGGSRGAGRLIACRLRDRGDPVRVVSRRPERARRRLPKSVTVVTGDITRQDTLYPPLSGVKHVIVTAGVRSGRPASESQIRRTEYEGILNVLGVLAETGFSGRFMYMTASGSVTRSVWSRLLNAYKGNTLVWRRRAEEAIRASGFDYTIVRAGVLVNRGAGRHPIAVTQRDLPLSPRYRIARADVADVFVAALESPHASHATFDVVWDDGKHTTDWQHDLQQLRSDEQLGR